jgi:glutamine amidotransferase
MVGIIHCGSGNIGSVSGAVSHLGGHPVIVERPGQMDKCSRLILPGVGSFREAVTQLHARSLWGDLQRFALESGRPVLGICLGMQIMASRGFEGGETEGLGWFEGSVDRIQTTKQAARLPHVGWNEVVVCQSHPLLAGIPDKSDFYFVHSYTVSLADKSSLVATCPYGDGVTAIMAKANIVAVQFHPEKSQDHGLRMLDNFLGWEPRC